MKIKTLLNTLGAAAVVALLASCSGQPKGGEPLDKAGAKNGSDSVSYYYGQLMAERMYQMSKQDSLFKDPKFVEAYWEGFKKAASLLRDGDSPADKGFNQGLAFGLQLYDQMIRTSQEMPEFKFNNKLFEAGYAYTMVGDSIRSTADAQSNLSSILEGMQKRMMAEENKVTEKNIKEYAAKNGFKKDAAGFYEKVEKQGTGATYVMGDSLTLSVEFASSTGRDMKQYSMPETPLVLGKTLPAVHPFANILLNTRTGSVVKVLMVPDEFYQGNAKQFGFKKGEFIIITLNSAFVAKTNFKAEAPAKAVEPVVKK